MGRAAGPAPGVRTLALCALLGACAYCSGSTAIGPGVGGEGGRMGDVDDPGTGASGGAPGGASGSTGTGGGAGGAGGPSPPDGSTTPPPPPPPVADTGGTQLLFTDVPSIPRGGFVTVWGRGLGAGGTLRVGGTVVPAGDILSWGPDANLAPALGLSRIEFRQTATGAGAIAIDGIAGSLPLAEHAGRLLYVSHAAGNDASDGLAPVAMAGGRGPWRTLPHARTQMLPGDVLYLRAGAPYTEIDDSTYGDMFHGRLMVGSAALPFAIIGYPGETPVVDRTSSGHRRAIYLAEAAHWTIAKLRFAGGPGLDLTINGDTMRAIGNESSNTGADRDGVYVFHRGSRHMRVLGNYLHDYGVPGSNTSQGIYHGSFVATNTDIEIAYNRMVNQRGGRHIQLYGHLDGELTTDIRIHHNHLDTSPYYGVLLGRSDAPGGDITWMEGVLVHNNTIRGNKVSCIHMNALGPRLMAKIYDNVCFASGTSSIIVTPGSTGTTEIMNNCLDKPVTNSVGTATANVHDNVVGYPACARGRGATP